MTDAPNDRDLSRRAFLERLGVLTGAVAAGGLGACARGMPGGAPSASRMSTAAWADRMGLQLFTVRDKMQQDFEGTLAQVAAAGIKEVEPVGYGSLSPQLVRAILDRLGLTAPSTHAALMPGPELERQLAGYQAMGHKYAAARTGGGRGPGGPPAGGPPGGPAAAAPAGPPRFTPPPQTPETVKRSADVYNEIGRAGKPYGVKVLIHNHTNEFERFADGSGTPFDLLFASVDPELVVFELDIGWATVAGQSALELFKQHPGRFPLWHVKDMADLPATRAIAVMPERQRAAKIVPVGQGEIDYRPIFAEAERAGLQHYFIEQDTAPASGDSLAAVRTSVANLRARLA
jgi:sugar phosphate isomerase/epimerase